MGVMETIVYISDFRLPFGLNFVKPLLEVEGYRKILIIERFNLENEEVLGPYFDEIRYIDTLESREQIHEHISEIRSGNRITALLTPGENAIEIGGEIRTAYGIQGLQRNQAEAVRNKWIMKQMLRQRGIRTSATAIAIGKKDYYDFVSQQGYPIIVKPLSGYGTINTFKLSNQEELDQYIHKHRIDGQRDLLEEFITGTEFHCDSIVSGGTVVFSSISQYLYNCLDIATKQRPPASITFPDANKPEYVDRIRDVNRAAIAALGINNSVTHAELFLTPEGEVVFGEIGARIGGSQVMPPCILNTHGVNMFEAVTQLEMGTYEWNPPMKKDKFTGMICFPSRAGVVERISTLEDFRHIPGIVEFHVSYKEGQRVGDVNDTMTRSGYAIVEGDSFDELRHTLLSMYEQFHLEVALVH